MNNNFQLVHLRTRIRILINSFMDLPELERLIRKERQSMRALLWYIFHEGAGGSPCGQRRDGISKLDSVFISIDNPFQPADLWVRFPHPTKSRNIPSLHNHSSCTTISSLEPFLHKASRDECVSPPLSLPQSGSTSSSPILSPPLPFTILSHLHSPDRT
jgi:hypothetical protein